MLRSEVSLLRVRHTILAVFTYLKVECTPNRNNESCDIKYGNIFRIESNCDVFFLFFFLPDVCCARVGSDVLFLSSYTGEF